eukprot:TRINITY_DN92_c0_g4_i3.p1 TRINITY_DN92_c0_g4~~TRINITY_DN92_c0_g4_i3.p1  ORF type:complete len:360 (-),score=27.11 TRINITY_DN92_c0_g4_i3:212-1291(-)
MHEQSTTLRFIILAGSLIGSFSIYGLLQEKIMTQPYSSELGGLLKQPPIDTTLLVFYNRVCAVILSAIIALGCGESLYTAAPIHRYFTISLVNSSATWCQYEALKYVNFPTQTLGKCCRIIPVMVVSKILNGKNYQPIDYFLSVMITIGCTVFLLNGDISSVSGEGNTPQGLILIAVFMALDGFTSTLQERLYKEYHMSAYNQLLYVNLCSGTICLLSLVFTGSLWENFSSLFTNQELFVDSTLLSLTSTLGQIALCHLIKENGAVVFATITVTRQIVSITLSCIIYLHPLTHSQTLGAFLVFGSLYLRALTSSSSRTPNKPSINIKSSGDGSPPTIEVSVLTSPSPFLTSVPSNEKIT